MVSVFQLLILSILLLAAGIILISFIPSKSKAIINFIFVVLIAVATSVPAVFVLSGKALDITIPGTFFFGDIPLRIDGLSAWFILIINLTAVNGALYGIGYMKPYREQKANLSLHWISFLIFHSSMLWVCMIQHSLVFLIAWELMSLSSLLLLIFDHQNKEVLKAGLNYMVQMHIAVAFLSFAFIWVYFSQGTFDFRAISDFFCSHNNIGLFLLFFIGFGLKAGFLPFHTWLPHAHPAAPSHISGVMSGVIVKIGIYGIIRVALMLKSDWLLIGEAMLVVSLFTGVFGILNAAVHRDFKKMLAYCTIENIGIIGIGIGLALIGIGSNNSLLFILGLSGALMHTLNHSLFKSLLFFSAGSIYQQTHTRDMEKLGGLIHKMPKTAVLFLIGALAISGLPPFNGFISEFLIYYGFLNGIQSAGLFHATLMALVLAGLAIIGALSLLTFTKSFSTIFLGSPRQELSHQPNEVSLAMRLPQFFIVGIILSIALFPAFYFSPLLNLIVSLSPLVNLNNYETLNFQSMTTLMANTGLYSLFFILLMTVVFCTRLFFIRNRPVRINSTWGCGYIVPRSNMQYTGKSFSKTLGKLLGFVLIERKTYTELSPTDIFPETRNHSSRYVDFFEDKLLNPLNKLLLTVMNYFQFIQNGKTQMYVLYGVFFIIIIFIGTWFNVIG